jgi:hypothetical protein
MVVNGAGLASALLVALSHGSAGAGFDATATELTGTVILQVVGR